MASSEQTPRHDRPERGALNKKLGHYASAEVPEELAFERMTKLHGGDRKRRFGWFWLPILLAFVVTAGVTALPVGSTADETDADPARPNEKSPATSESILTAEISGAKSDGAELTPQLLAEAKNVTGGLATTLSASSTNAPAPEVTPVMGANALSRDTEVNVIVPPSADVHNSILSLTTVSGAVPRHLLDNVPDGSQLIRTDELPSEVRSDVPISPPLVEVIDSLGGLTATSDTQRYRWLLDVSGGRLTADIEGNAYGGVGELTVGRRLNKHWVLSVGLGYEEVRRVYKFDRTEEVLLYRPGTLDTLFQRTDGTVIREVFTDSVPGIRNVKFANTDRFFAWHLPVRLDWEARWKRVEFGAGAVLTYRFARGENVERVTNAGLPREVGAIRQHSVSLGGRVLLGYGITERLSARITYEYRSALSDWKVPEGLRDTRLRMQSATVGVRYRW